MPINSATFNKYLTDVLVETGTCRGEGSKAGIDAGFKNVITFEVMPELVKFSTMFLSEYIEKRILNIVHGSSAKLMWEYIKDIDTKITFFHDAHGSGGPTGFDEKFNPIMEELEIVKKHPIKTHNLLIDDVRLMGSKIDFCGITEQQIKNKILEINPNYHFSYEDGFIPKDILVATI